MPSASTTRPFTGSAAIESSLCERTMPGSVQVAISRVWVSSMSELEVDRGRLRRGRFERRLQRAAEVLAGLEALVGILGERALEEARDARRHGGIHAENVGRRLVRDLEHELRHRLAVERQLASHQQVERHRELEQIRAAVDALAGELLL